VTSETDNDGLDLAFAGGLAEEASLWRAATAVLGISLWAQLFWYPLAAEFLADQTGGVFVLLYLMPAVVLVTAMFVRHGAAYLFAFPTSMLPGLAILPEQDAVALMEFERAVFAAGTLVAYAVAAAVATRLRDREPTETDPLDELVSRRIDGIYRHYVTVRLVILVVLFGILVGSGVFDPEIRGTIATHHEGGRVAAQMFVTVFGWFVWCVLAYAMFFLPVANIEYDVRRMSRTIDQMADGRSAIRWRLGLLTSGGLALAAAYLLWQTVV